MGLAPGTRIASYEIVSPLRAGGMAEVYRAFSARWTSPSRSRVTSGGALSISNIERGRNPPFMP